MNTYYNGECRSKQATEPIVSFIGLAFFWKVTQLINERAEQKKLTAVNKKYRSNGRQMQIDLAAQQALEDNRSISLLDCQNECGFQAAHIVLVWEHQNTCAVGTVKIPEADLQLAVEQIEEIQPATEATMLHKYRTVCGKIDPFICSIIFKNLDSEVSREIIDKYWQEYLLRVNSREEELKLLEQYVQCADCKQSVSKLFAKLCDKSQHYHCFTRGIVVNGKLAQHTGCPKSALRNFMGDLIECKQCYRLEEQDKIKMAEFEEYKLMVLFDDMMSDYYEFDEQVEIDREQNNLETDERVEIDREQNNPETDEQSEPVQQIERNIEQSVAEQIDMESVVYLQKKVKIVDQLKAMAKQIKDSEDPIAAAKQIAKQITETSDKATTVNSRLTRMRQELIKIGFTQQQARELILSTEEWVDLCKKQQYERQQEVERVGINRIEQFQTPDVLKQRLSAIDMKKTPTIDNLVDVMVLFCSRVKEIQTLKLHIEDIQNPMISGFSKNTTGNLDEQRPFISIYDRTEEKSPMGDLVFIQSLLWWVQSVSWVAVLKDNNLEFNNHLKSNYNGITSRILRKFGVDLILQQLQPKNPSHVQQIIMTATRHMQSLTAERFYGIINDVAVPVEQVDDNAVVTIIDEQPVARQQQVVIDQQFARAADIYPSHLLGFKISQNARGYHIAIKKIKGKKYSISLDKYYPEIEQRIRDYCDQNSLQIQ